MTKLTNEKIDRKTTLGQLIVEISKFGGSDNKKASQLATILLPHIDQYAQSLIHQAEIAGELRGIENTMEAWNDNDSSGLLQWASVEYNRLSALENAGLSVIKEQL